MTPTMTATVVVLRVVVRRAHRVTRRAPSLAMAVEVTAVTRRVKRAARHAHRASRARMRTSSPRIARIVAVSVPPAHDRHAHATAALARSLDRARCGVGNGGEGGGRLHRALCASRKTRVTRVHEHAINAHRARHYRFPFPPGTRELRRRRRSLVARSRARDVASAMAVEKVVGYIARHARSARCASRARRRI